MTKKRNLIIPYILLIITLIIIGYLLKLVNNQKILLSKYKMQDDTLLSMMMENENGEYEESYSNTWPSKGYILNKERSGCENGGSLDYHNNNVYVKADSSDRCYVYFAIDNFENRCLLNYEESFACDLIENKDNSLIYHDGKADYDGMPNSALEVGDLSYRFVGASPNNYVCFGGDCSIDSNNANYKNLYRIIGIFKNDAGKYEVKLIKADAATKEDLGEGTYPNSAYAGNYSWNKPNYKGKLIAFASYYWNSTSGAISSSNNVNMWAASNLNIKNLNETFFNAIDPTYQSMIEKHSWQVGPTYNLGNAKEIYDYELGANKLTQLSNNCYAQGNTIEKKLCNGENDLEYKAHVGLMYISDYMYGTLPEYWHTEASNYNQDEVKNNNWLYIGIYEWTISRYSKNGFFARYISYTGGANNNYGVYYGFGIRPVLHLSSNVKISGGSGTEKEHYKLAL